MLLNNRLILQAAQRVQIRAKVESESADPAAQIQRAWQIIFGRPATDHEIRSALKFVNEQQDAIKTSQTSSAEDDAMADLCHALLNTNEFLFVE